LGSIDGRGFVNVAQTFEDLIGDHQLLYSSELGVWAMLLDVL